ncbi:MAG: DUF3237 domain-containing protein [Alphaproteobacteria bacterium]|nr:DUF3237 domain-containing protein [Alphaproteobacteria bacterium]
MLELKSEYLFDVHADLREAIQVGATPAGQRVIADVTGGRIEGRVTGTLLPSGADWLIIGGDGCGRIDVRAAARLDDGSVLYMTYNGRLFIPPEIAPKVMNRATVEQVDPSSYYFRVAPTYETASTQYAWLNRIQALGIGRMTKTGVAYKIYEIK